MRVNTGCDSEENFLFNALFAGNSVKRRQFVQVIDNKVTDLIFYRKGNIGVPWKKLFSIGKPADTAV